MLSFLDTEHLYQLPAHVYEKDHTGAFINANFALARSAGLASTADFKGHTDHAFCWHREAARLQANDRQVIETRAPLIIVEHGTNYLGVCEAVLSYKFPLINQMQKVMGIFGISFLLNQSTDAEEILTKVNSSSIVSRLNLSQNMFNHTLVTNLLNQKLTAREEDVLGHLIQGKTAKGIGKLLTISPRTVEIHIQNIKNKFNVKSKSELIEKVLTLYR